MEFLLFIAILVPITGIVLRKARKINNRIDTIFEERYKQKHFDNLAHHLSNNCDKIIKNAKGNF